MRHLVIISSLALAVSLAAPISAAETATLDASDRGWSSATTNITWTGSGARRKYQGVALPMESIYSGPAEASGNVAFTCYAGAFSANVAFEPVDMKEIILNPPKTRRAKLRRPDVKIDGEFLKFTDWIYVHKMKIYRARKQSTAAKLYNAIIRGSVVEMREQGGDYIQINLPPIDRVFSQFGSECGIGVAAKKT